MRKYLKTTLNHKNYHKRFSKYSNNSEKIVNNDIKNIFPKFGIFLKPKNLNSNGNKSFIGDHISPNKDFSEVFNFFHKLCMFEGFSIILR